MGARTVLRGALLAATVAAGLLRIPIADAAGPETRPQRILSIHQYEPGIPANSAFTTELRTALPLGTELSHYSEHLDRARFPDAAYVAGFRAWLRAKYASTPPDVIVAVGLDAVDFLADPATTPFPGVPVVFGLVPEQAIAARRLPSSFTGVVEHYAIRETLALAFRLFPGTEHVALVGGAASVDWPLNELLQREVTAAELPVDVIELFGLPMKDLQDRLRALPPRTIVLGLTFIQDGTGRLWTGPRAVPAIVSASSAPMFTLVANVMGSGTVGGVQTDLGESAKVVAGIAMRILAGERPDAIEVRRSGANRLVLDGRQLDRWRVPAARVPAGADIRFREPSAWARYRWQILLAAVGFLVQSSLIALLLVERRRRWRAEAKARENLTIVAHMNRISAVGELVGSLAHEINSPLGAALNNAEAAGRLLDSGRAHDPEVRSCLEDIARDVTRAGQVLRRIRGALRNETWTPVDLDVATVIRDALHLVEAEARDRGVAVEVQVPPSVPSVTGDAVQLSQVIVNLVVNALDAVRGLPEPRRRIRITAERAGERVAIRVLDSGPGIPRAIADRVFDPFFTTKASRLGMGLAITRSIVEAHDGTIAVSEAPGGGTAFEVLLPAAHRQPAPASSLA